MTIKGWILAVAAALVCWLGVQVLVMRFSDAAPGAIALFPPAGFVTRLPVDVAIVGAGSYWIAVQRGSADLGAGLYRAGAWLVLPAGLPGCLPLPATS